MSILMLNKYSLVVFCQDTCQLIKNVPPSRRSRVHCTHKKHAHMNAMHWRRGSTTAVSGSARCRDELLMDFFIFNPF